MKCGKCGYPRLRYASKRIREKDVLLPRNDFAVECNRCRFKEDEKL